MRTHLVLAHLCLEEVLGDVHREDVAHQLHVVLAQGVHLLFLLVCLRQQR